MRTEMCEKILSMSFIWYDRFKKKKKKDSKNWKKWKKWPKSDEKDKEGFINCVLAV